jgi:ABC-type multidrug transport system fused ATPase/permease subunit
MNIYIIIKKYKWRIALIYLYVLIAQCMFLLEPYLLGKAIDQLLSGTYTYLFLLLSVFLSENFFTYRRMVYDTKVWTGIYNEIVFDYLDRDKSSDSSTRIARTELAHNIIGFLEGELQYFITALMSIVGCLYFIFLGSWSTGVVILFCIPPIVYIVSCFWRKIAKGTHIGNSHYEQKFGIMDRNHKDEVETFFKRRMRLVIAQSTLQGKHWASLNMVKSLFLVGAVIVFTQQNGLTQGEAVAMYAYINQFLISLMSVPIGVETVTRVRDTLKRIEN